MPTVKHVRASRKRIVDRYKLSKGCSICGYKKNPRALCFDHIDPATKADSIKNGMSSTGLRGGGMYNLYHKSHTPKELVDEIRKCRILCANCHTEETFK